MVVCVLVSLQPYSEHFEEEKCAEVLPTVVLANIDEVSAVMLC